MSCQEEEGAVTEVGIRGVTGGGEQAINTGIDTEAEVTRIIATL